MEVGGGGGGGGGGEMTDVISCAVKIGLLEDSAGIEHTLGYFVQHAGRSTMPSPMK